MGCSYVLSDLIALKEKGDYKGFTERLDALTEQEANELLTFGRALVHFGETHLDKIHRDHYVGSFIQT